MKKQIEHKTGYWFNKWLEGHINTQALITVVKQEYNSTPESNFGMRNKLSKMYSMLITREEVIPNTEGK